MKQKKIDNDDNGYETPLEHLISFLYVPKKTYQIVYIAIVEKYLSGRPYTIGFNDDPYPAIAHKVNIEPGLAREKVVNLETMKWIRLQKVENTAIRVLEPIWRHKKEKSETEFALALQKYRDDIKEDEAHQMSTEEIYTLMNSICPRTHEKRDEILCEVSRWVECKRCKYSKKSGTKEILNNLKCEEIKNE
jgi:hypothetical protein